MRSTARVTSTAVSVPDRSSTKSPSPVRATTSSPRRSRRRAVGHRMLELLGQRVTEAVVHGLEAVDPEGDDGEASRGGLRLADQTLQARLELVAVGHRGEVALAGGELRPRLREADLGDVDEDDEGADLLPLRDAEERLAGDLDPAAERAVAADHAQDALRDRSSQLEPHTQRGLGARQRRAVGQPQTSLEAVVGRGALGAAGLGADADQLGGDVVDAQDRAVGVADDDAHAEGVVGRDVGERLLALSWVICGYAAPSSRPPRSRQKHTRIHHRLPPAPTYRTFVGPGSTRARGCAPGPTPGGRTGYTPAP